MEKTRNIFWVGRKWRLLSSNYRNTSVGIVVPHSMPVTTKTSDRAAVHGVKSPLPDILDKEQAEKDIEKAKQDKEAKRKHIEKTIHSYLTKYDSP
ncbi:unnamed protein product [Lathyrus sativus]|nr:unnamed protein product [Lathyrus sativus]